MGNLVPIAPTPAPPVPPAVDVAAKDATVAAPAATDIQGGSSNKLTRCSSWLSPFLPSTCCSCICEAGNGGGGGGNDDTAAAQQAKKQRYRPTELTKRQRKEAMASHKQAIAAWDWRVRRNTIASTVPMTAAAPTLANLVGGSAAGRISTTTADASPVLPPLAAGDLACALRRREEQWQALLSSFPDANPRVVLAVRTADGDDDDDDGHVDHHHHPHHHHHHHHHQYLHISRDGTQAHFVQPQEGVGGVGNEGSSSGASRCAGSERVRTEQTRKRVVRWLETCELPSPDAAEYDAAPPLLPSALATTA